MYTNDRPRSEKLELEFKSRTMPSRSSRKSESSIVWLRTDSSWSAHGTAIRMAASCKSASLRESHAFDVFLRPALIEVLRSAAEEAGVEIVTSSRAVAADPAGELVLENGRRFRADLVIAADGAQSKLRARSISAGAIARCRLS